jgi:signal transduction histidine kinase
MSGIIQFFLDFTRDRRGTEGPGKILVPLASVVEHSVREVSPQAKTKNVDMVIPSLSSTEIYGNATILKILVLNLLRNAVAYTPERGMVMVSVRDNLSSVLLTVEDTGSGFSRRDLWQVFQPFSSRMTRTDVAKRLGFGLAIVKDVVEFHNAKLSVRSRPGKGTAFTISFPQPRKSRFFIFEGLAFKKESSGKDVSSEDDTEEAGPIMKQQLSSSG